MILIPLYWQLDLPAASALLLTGQLLIAVALWRSLSHQPGWHGRLRPGDWHRTAFGGYTLRIGQASHGQGGNPSFDIRQEDGLVRGLIDEEGNIHLFCDRPVQANIQIWRQSWQRLQSGDGTMTIQSLPSRSR